VNNMTVDGFRRFKRDMVATSGERIDDSKWVKLDLNLMTGPNTSKELFEADATLKKDAQTEPMPASVPLPQAASPSVASQSSPPQAAASLASPPQAASLASPPQAAASPLASSQASPLASDHSLTI